MHSVRARSYVYIHSTFPRIEVLRHVATSAARSASPARRRTTVQVTQTASSVRSLEYQSERKSVDRIVRGLFD